MSPMDVSDVDHDRIGRRKIGSFRAEMRDMPPVIRITVWLSLFCLVMLSLQCIFIMPVIVMKYGWGYGGAYVTAPPHPGGAPSTVSPKSDGSTTWQKQS